MSTLLADLVRRQTATSLSNVIGRIVDRAAEELALDLLRDAEFRTEMQALIRVAFTQALTELQKDTPEKPNE